MRGGALVAAPLQCLVEATADSREDQVTAYVEVRGLRKRFDESWAVDDVNFEVEKGNLLVLLGPSGCGKTTTLRCVGGLEQPESGEIVIDGEVMTKVDEGLFVPPNARGMGMVAQSYAIWPHMSVHENVAFPLRMRKENSSEISRRVRDALDVVRLGDFGSRNATDLSGGQQQRVALARAIVGNPKVLLFDEPLSNLDAKLREEMRYLLKDIQRGIGTTAIYVTHDQAEAMALGDELLVMNAGRIEQRGDARSLYSEPKTRFVADFIGVANLLKGRIESGRPTESRLVEVRLDGKDGDSCVLHVSSVTETLSGDVTVVVRPEWMRVHRTKPESEENLIGGRVHKSQYLGDRTEMLVDTGFARMRVWVDGDQAVEDGSAVHLEIDNERCVALPVG